MPEPTTTVLNARLRAAATVKVAAETAWLKLEDQNVAGDAAKTGRQAAWRTLKDAEDEADRAAALVTRRAEREGVI